MKILIDMQGLQNDSRYRGIGRYSDAFVRSFITNNTDHQIFLLFNKLFDKEFEEIVADFSTLVPTSHILYFNAPGPADELLETNLWRVRSGEFLREMFIQSLNIDFLIITSLFEGACDNTIVSLGNLYRTYKTAVILYDLIPYLDQEKYIGWAPSRAWYFRKIDALKRADILLSISSSARDEAIIHLDIPSSRVVNISSAVSKNFHEGLKNPTDTTNFKEKFSINKPYLMHTSAFDERKNFHGLIRAFGLLPANLKQQYQLVLVCKLTAEQKNDLYEYATSHNVSLTSLVLTGFVSDAELLSLYRHSHLFVFPSFHEGFGLPPLEAMTCGVPTVGSNVSSIPEVIGDTSALFNPHSDSEITAIIQKALQDKAFYKRLKKNAQQQAKKFSWDDTAKTALNAIETAFNKNDITLAFSPSLESLFNYSFKKLVLTYKPSQEELLATCQAIAENMRLIEKFNIIHNFASLSWQIEGPFDSSYSLASVNRESARAVSALGQKTALYSTEGPGDFDPNPAYLAQHNDIAKLYQNSLQKQDWDIVSRNLFPPRVSEMHGKFNLMHFYGWEESGFPQDWMAEFNKQLDGMFCMSTHVSKIMRDNGFEKPCIATGLGIDYWQNIQPTKLTLALRNKKFKFIHVSSCFPRKGVDIMLEAYGKAFTKQDDVVLIIKTFKNIHNDVSNQIQHYQQANPNYPEIQLIEEDIADNQLKALYEVCDVLVAPSKAEGFGLPMAEAMLSGLPVITTNWGGQTDFCNPLNAWMLDYEFEYSDTHLDVQPSVWARPHVDSLIRAFRQAFNASAKDIEQKINLGRRNLLENFKWTDVVTQALYNIHLDKFLPYPTSKPRVAWISTWNTKCGIAKSSEHLIENLDGLDVQIFSPKVSLEELILPSDNSIRSWHTGKEENTLQALQVEIEKSASDIILLQFNYGFYNFHELNDFLIYNKRKGRTVLAILHSTHDPFQEDSNWLLSTLKPGLELCDRILVHSVKDMNELKKLGIIANVTLFPLGLLDFSDELANHISDKKPIPVVSSYGFALPHKGLKELVLATAQLRDNNTPIHLKLINATHSHPSSLAVTKELQQLIQELQLKDYVTTEHRFLSDEETLKELLDSDLITFAYQDTGESASAAVRQGLSTSLPVAVTPLSIFDEVKNITFTMSGTNVDEISKSLSRILDDIKNQTESYKNIMANSKKWRERRSYKSLGKRLSGLLRGLYFDKPIQEWTYHATDSALDSQVGKVEATTLVSMGTKGYLVYGGYHALRAGKYTLTLKGTFSLSKDSLSNVDIFSALHDKLYYGQLLTDLLTSAKNNDIIQIDFQLEHDVEDLQIRIWVDEMAKITFYGFQIIQKYY